MFGWRRHDAVNVYPKWLYEPHHRESRLGQWVLLKRVCGQPLQVSACSGRLSGGWGGGMLYLLRHLVQKSFVKYIKYKNYENWVSMAMKCRFWKIYTFNCSSWKMLFICCIMFVLCCDTISFQILCQPVFGVFCVFNSQVGLKTNTLYFCFRDVFTAWVSSRQGSNQFTVKWSAYFEGTH